MKRITKVLVSILMLTLSVSSASAETNSINNVSSSEFDWNPVMEAIIQVESEGNPKAKSGNSVGVMQITPILVAECNNILKKKKSKKRYTLSDRYSISKSRRCSCSCSLFTILLIASSKLSELGMVAITSV